MPAIKDLKGKRFFKLLVVGYAGQNKHRKSLWTCLCDCGATTVAVGNSLTSTLTKSCGCYQRTVSLTHGDSRIRGGIGSPEYRVWAGLLARCRNASQKNYGGRGISVCERWESFENFLADMGRRPSPKHSIDRVDNDGNYEPGNCRWAVKKQQDRNRRTNRPVEFRGETKCLTEWAEMFGLNPAALAWRLNHGWGTEEAITTPSGSRL